MNRRLRHIAASVIAALFCAISSHAADEKPADGKPNRAERAANKAAKGVEKTAKRTGEWADRTANRAGKAVERTVDKTGKWIKKQTD